MVNPMQRCRLAGSAAGCRAGRPAPAKTFPKPNLSRAQLAVDRAVAAAGRRAGARPSWRGRRAARRRRARRSTTRTTPRRDAWPIEAEADATLAETRAQAAIESENLKQMQGTVGDLRETALPPTTLSAAPSTTPQ